MYAAKSAKTVLAKKWSCTVSEERDNRTDLFNSWKIDTRTGERTSVTVVCDSQEDVASVLNKRFEEANDTKREAQEEIHSIYKRLRKEANEFGIGLNSKLERALTKKTSGSRLLWAAHKEITKKKKKAS